MSSAPRRFPWPLMAALLLVAAPVATADDEKPALHVVRARPFVVTLDLKANFTPQEAVVVAYEPEEYGASLKVVEAVEPGPVVAGQTLVRFDDEDIVEALRARERDLFAARAKLEKQEAELRQKTEHVAIQREIWANTLERAEEGLERFRKLSKPTRIAQSAHNLKGSENRIQDEVEELAQLQRMYEADDLTEETEAIVLRRTKRNLARMRTSFEWAKQRHRDLVELTLPREEADLVLNLRRKKIDHDTYLATSAADVRRAELDLEKARDAYAQQEKKLAHLRADRDALRVAAPADGYAVPGSFKGTGWGDIAAMRQSLSPGKTLKARQTLFTIVRPGDVRVAAEVGEADLLKLKAGQEAEVRAGMIPGRVLDAVVQEVLPVGSGGKYAVRIDLKETDAALLPGYGAKVRVRLSVKPDALSVPSHALRVVDGKPTVWLWVDGKAAPRAVKTGAESGGRVEILEGLDAGDEILEKAPSEEEA